MFAAKLFLVILVNQLSFFLILLNIDMAAILCTCTYVYIGWLPSSNKVITTNILYL